MTQSKATYTITGEFDIADLVSMVDNIKDALDDVRQSGTGVAEVTIPAETSFMVDT